MAEKYDDRLEALFDVARSDNRAAPDADFMARVLNDALTHQPAPAAPVAPAPKRGWLTRAAGDLSAVFGGWRPMSGLALAAMVGVWIGFSGLSMLPDSLNGLLGADNETYLADLDFEVAFDLGEG